MRKLHNEMAQKENMKSLQEELSMNNELNVTNVNVENMTEAQADTMPVPPALQEDIPAEVLEAVQKSAEMDTTAEVETTDTSEQAEPKPVPPLPEADMDMIRKTIEVFQESDSIFEMRTFPTLGGRSGHIWVKNTPDGVERFIKTIEEENLTGASLCMTLQHINQDTEKIHDVNKFLSNMGGTCTADADVDRYRFIHIDCDPKRKPNDQGTTVQADEEEVEHGRNKVAEVKAFLSEKGWAEPIEAFSGNGHTLDYAVDEPVNNESKVMFKKLLEVLKDKFADEFVKIDTTVSSSGQIIKLYGCVSCKGKHTADRPYRVTKLLHVPENREFVTKEQVQSLINELDVKPEKKKSTKATKTNSDKGKCAKIGNVPAWLDYYNIEYDMTEEEYEGKPSTKFVFKNCPLEKHDNHKCSALFQYKDKNVHFNCFHDGCKKYTIHDVLKKYPIVKQIPLMQGDKDIMLISAKDESGISEFKEKIEEMFLKGLVDYNDEVIITNVRHLDLIRKSIISLDEVRAGIDKELSLQIYKDNLDFIIKELDSVIDAKLEPFIKSQRKINAKHLRTSAINTYLQGEVLHEDEEERYKRIKKRKMKKKKYSQIFPKKNYMNNYPPDIPYSYNYKYNLNLIGSQNIIGNRKYYEAKENNVLGDNCSYKKIGVLPAVEINHLHSNNIIVLINIYLL